MKKASGKSNIDIVRNYLSGERPFLQVGYGSNTDKYVIRKDGETWTDSRGQRWVQKEGTAQTVTRVMDIVREETNDKCSKCGREIRWGNKYDRKMFNRTKRCFDCLVEEETMLRIKGQFQLYETKKLVENELSYLNEVKQKLKESKEYLSSDTSKVLTYVNSNGMVEEWSNAARKELQNNVKKDWVACLKKIKFAESELKNVNDEIDRVIGTR